MNIEITDLDMILNHLETTSLEPHDDYSSEFTYKDQKILYKYIKQLQQENKILKENAENNDKVVDKVNWENQLLKKENKQLKDELKSKPDAQITLQDDKGNKFMLIQTERIDMQVELNKTIEKLFNNWNKLKEIAKSQSGFKKRADLKGGLWFEIDELLDKMQELEQGSDNNE